MHYYALAILPAEGDLESLLAQTMAPFDENREVEQFEEDGETYWRNPIGIWDWYQVGGRYTGALSDYDPRTDPANWERCTMCGGTGRREDRIALAHRAQNPDHGCNGCERGRALKWPTQWAKRPDVDVVPAVDVAARLDDVALPFTIFTHDSEHVTIKTDYGREDYREATLSDQDIRVALATILNARMKAGLVDRVVVVDYHS